MPCITFDNWLRGLETRHLADLRFAEVTRGLRALSSTYVQRRTRLASRGAFDGAGKRAAYALYYGPLHFLTVDRILDRLGRSLPPSTLLDLGCGTGAAGAAWACRLDTPPIVRGVDAHPWAVAEAAFTYRSFGLAAEVRGGRLARTRVPRSVDAIVAGWVVNELDETTRALLLSTLVGAAAAGTAILIVEPIAARLASWWTDWVRAFAPMHARADEWRFQVELPDLLSKLDRAAGLKHDVLKARSLYVAPHGKHEEHEKHEGRTSRKLSS